MTDLTPFAIYLIFTADSIKPMFAVIGVAASIFGGILLWCGIDEDVANAIKAGKRILPCGLLALTLAVLTPSTKTLVAMYGIPAAIEGAKSAATSEVGQKAYSAVNKLLDGYLSDKSK